MLNAERMELIRDYIIRNKYGSITELSAKLNTSPATIRRCFKQLEEENLVESIRGGVVLVSNDNINEQPYLVKRQQNIDEKVRIAAAACGHVNPDDCIFLDSSSTVYEMCGGLKDIQSLSICTNDVLIASALNTLDNCTVMVTGGTVRKGYYTLTGYFSYDRIQQIHVDSYFAGVDAVTPNGDFMITNIEEVDAKRYLVENSNKCIVLCDHEKFMHSSFIKLWNYSQVDTVITGRELDDEIYRKYVDMGMSIIRV